MTAAISFRISLFRFPPHLEVSVRGLFKYPKKKEVAYKFRR